MVVLVQHKRSSGPTPNLKYIPVMYPAAMAPETTADDRDEQQPALGSGKPASEYDAGTVNMDVSGTVGPDYLGQQTVDVDGHPYDRPGVQMRTSENDPRRGRQDTGEQLPVLLSSDMRTDPIEGTQGSFTIIEEGWCPRCGYDRLRTRVQTMAGVRKSQCMACDAIVEPRSEQGFRMPQTSEDRAQLIRDCNDKVGDTGLGDVYRRSDYAVHVLRPNSGPSYIPIDDLLELIDVCLHDGILEPAQVLGLFDWDLVSDLPSGALKPDETGLTDLDSMLLAIKLTERTVGLESRSTIDPLTNLDDDVVRDLVGFLVGGEQA